MRSEDAAPSVFFDLVARLAGTPRENDVVPLDVVEAPLSLPGHIADLRARAASSDDTVDSQLAATLLALMAREGITSAQSERWLGAGGTPTTNEEYQGDVKLSPSQLSGRWPALCVGSSRLSALRGRRMRRPAWEPSFTRWRRRIRTAHRRN